MCSNCRQVGHSSAKCNQPRAARAQVRFVTPPPKEDAQVNLVELSPEDKEEDNSWPDEETMVGRVDHGRTGLRCKKEATLENAKRDKTGTKKKDSKGKESRELQKDPSRRPQSLRRRRPRLRPKNFGLRLKKIPNPMG